MGKPNSYDLADQLEASDTRLAQALDALRVAVEALEPFAEHFYASPRDASAYRLADDHMAVSHIGPQWKQNIVTVGDFRRARAACAALAAQTKAKVGTALPVQDGGAA